MNYLWYLLGYEEEIEADERQKNLKHLLCKQIKCSNFRLKPINNKKSKRKRKRRN